MRTVLICHHDSQLDRKGIASWLDSTSDLCAIVQIRDGRNAVSGRLRREFRRSGLLGLADALAFRAFYRIEHAAKDREIERTMLTKTLDKYPRHARETPLLEVEDPNSKEVLDFLANARPDVVIARCKHLLRESIFSIPLHGTYVLHPGICPQYRNAHGCFWALAQGDPRNVGATLLRIDKGIDTGPVYAHYRIQPGNPRESHMILQHRAVMEHLDQAMNTLGEICAGIGKPIDTSTSKSAVWGQPRLSAYLRAPKN
jgi:folate-dependent phosphoribosylglycinamide formyltransferase PurN